MNVTPPPTHLTEVSQPGAGSFTPGGTLAETGYNTVSLVVFAALLIGCAVAVLLLRAYLIRNEGNGLTPLPHGETHADVWSHGVRDHERMGLSTDEASKRISDEMGWKPGDPT